MLNWVTLQMDNFLTDVTHKTSKIIHMKLKANIAISDSGFVFNPSTGESYSVNPIGIELITMIKNGKEFEEILKEVLLKYNTDEASFEKDYFDFIGQLKQYYLLDTEDDETEA